MMLAANLLVLPDPPPPQGFAPLRMVLDRGLPARAALDATSALMLTFPTGELARWLQADPAQILSDEMDEVAPVRLVYLASGQPAAAVPLVRGARQLLGPAGRAEVEVLVTAWRVLVGDLVGQGRRGSYVALLWRRVDRGAAFAAPTARPEVLARLGDDGAGTRGVGDQAPGGMDWGRRHGPR
ncbi:MAG: hypothetical protein H7317_03250 [Pseudorhodobacter sp.]|nr:hypothetical protein [Pseudorhodobacter sp.]